LLLSRGLGATGSHFRQAERGRRAACAPPAAAAASPAAGDCGGGGDWPCCARAARALHGGGVPGVSSGLPPLPTDAAPSAALGMVEPSPARRGGRYSEM